MPLQDRRHAFSQLVLSLGQDANAEIALVAIIGLGIQVEIAIAAPAGLHVQHEDTRHPVGSLVCGNDGCRYTWIQFSQFPGTPLSLLTAISRY